MGVSDEEEFGIPRRSVHSLLSHLWRSNICHRRIHSLLGQFPMAPFCRPGLVSHSPPARKHPQTFGTAATPIPELRIPEWQPKGKQRRISVCLIDFSFILRLDAPRASGTSTRPLHPFRGFSNARETTPTLNGAHYS